MEFKLIKSSKGTRYMKDNRFIAKANIPEDILKRLEADDHISTSKDCIFCGEPSKFTRLLNSQPLPLCNEHYYGKTIGQVAQQVRERNTPHG